MEKSNRRTRNPFIRLSRRRRVLLLYAILGSLILHLAFLVPVLIPGILFAAKAPPPEPIPVEIVTLPPKPAEEAKVEPPPPPAPQPEQPPPPPPPPPPKVEVPPPNPPPPVTPQQIVVATRDVATPPQGDDKPTAAPEKQEPEDRPIPPPKPEAKPEPPKPEPKPEPKPQPKAEPKPEPPEREVTSAIALNKPRARPRDQVTDAEHKLPPVVVRPLPPGRAGNSLMPSYPSSARANGLQGRVVLLVTLSEQGRPRRIDIARSSGYDQLDESAVRAVWQWRFYRTDSGPPVEATIEIPLDFRL